MANGDVAGETEVLRLEDLVGGGVVEDGLGVNTGLVGEGTVTPEDDVRLLARNTPRHNLRDGVHERHVDFDGLGNKVLDFTEYEEIVLLELDIVWFGGTQAGNKASKRSDADTFTDT